jgi:predicted phosphodiesterase
MKFAIISDLHMEFQPWLHDPDPELFYLNSGDTHPRKLMRDYFESLYDGKIFSIKGNHDYYGNSFVGAEDDFLSRNVDGVKIVGATLWTDLSPLRWDDFKSYMMDYRQISNMTYDRYMMAHRIHHDFLFSSDADIWVVHHLPSYQSVHEKFCNSDGNDFFATELSYKILDMKRPPKLIVHGHTHERTDYMIGNTRVVCHPRGYPNENEWYKNYQPLVIEV